MCSLEGEHVKLAVLAALFILIYLVGVPSFYCYILFRVLPKHGRGSTLGQAFGFLYGRFDQKVYWWELMEIFRKVSYRAVLVTASVCWGWVRSFPQSALRQS